MSLKVSEQESKLQLLWKSQRGNMRIKIVGKTDPKSLALLLVDTLSRMDISELNGASLYFGNGNEVITVSAKGKSGKHKKAIGKKRAAVNKPICNSWEPRQSGTKKIIIDDGTCPFETEKVTRL